MKVVDLVYLFHGPYEQWALHTFTFDPDEGDVNFFVNVKIWMQNLQVQCRIDNVYSRSIISSMRLSS